MDDSSVSSGHRHGFFPHFRHLPRLLGLKASISSATSAASSFTHRHGFSPHSLHFHSTANSIMLRNGRAFTPMCRRAFNTLFLSNFHFLSEAKKNQSRALVYALTEQHFVCSCLLLSRSLINHQMIFLNKLRHRPEKANLVPVYVISHSKQAEICEFFVTVRRPHRSYSRPFVLL